MWISVKDRLPEIEDNGNFMLIAYSNGVMEWCKFCVGNNGEQKYWDTDWMFDMDVKITHWMRMPAPPDTSEPSQTIAQQPQGEICEHCSSDRNGSLFLTYRDFDYCPYCGRKLSPVR